MQAVNIRFAVLVSAMLAGMCISSYADDDEEVRLKTSSTEFVDAIGKSGEILAKSNLPGSLSSTALGAMSSDEFAKTVAAIKAEKPIPGIGVGSSGTSYDIIVQPGHYGRTTGRVGTAGARVSERALNSYLVGIIATDLKAAKLKYLIVPADGVPSGLQTKVFLAIHADGSTKACATGPSLAYKKNSSLFAMHAIGFGLSRAFGYDFDEFEKDNFTADEAHYYMFSKVNASIMEGLLEVGELTCDRSEDRLVEASASIAHNVATTLAYIANLPGN